ncbi:hypothetical protein D854_gp46 [Streptomyces phage R4]|uniref:Uncharacterized protein n=1 Tax=Streptomyces phage R4 TaxID=10732 RepID=K4HY94_9CAUD|nr:hypothetical protein D854_gp46 [Streptomyces phage R4]AFU62096.1 hypothetical protein R4_43 [Streptomyces phage R4]
MAAELKHGRLAYVVVHGTHEVVLARYTQHDPEESGYFAFFGTEFTAWPEDVEIVELAVTRSV